MNIIFVGRETPNILEIIKKLRDANLGDSEKLDFLYKVVKLGRNLRPSDEDYLLKLYYQLENKGSEKIQATEKDSQIDKDITDFKEKVYEIKKQYREKAITKVKESKFKLAGGKYCVRCNTMLGFRKQKPEKIWGITRELCKICYDYIKINVTNYPAMYKEGTILLDDKKGVLSVQHFDDTNQVVFGTKYTPQQIVIPVSKILAYKIIDYEEFSKKRKILTMGLKSSTKNPHLLIHHTSNNGQRTDLILQLKRKDLSNSLNSIGNLVLSYQKRHSQPINDSVSKIKE